VPNYTRDSANRPEGGTKVVVEGADRASLMLDHHSGKITATQVAAHDQPMRDCRFVDVAGAAGPIPVMGFWDKTIKYWDLRTPNLVALVDCQERLYTMDTNHNLFVVGTADRYITLINLNEPYSTK